MGAWALSRGAFAATPSTWVRAHSSARSARQRRDFALLAPNVTQRGRRRNEADSCHPRGGSRASALVGQGTLS